MNTSLEINAVEAALEASLALEPTLTPTLTASTEELEYDLEPVPSVGPWTYEDGHLVGDDGFVVPNDFAEFYERFPRYCKNFVSRHMPKCSTSASEREDRVNDLLMHLMTLPENSKFRTPGYNDRPEGCTDRIQTFSPERFYGASLSRFFSFINLCLLNHFISLRKKAGSNPILRYNTVPLFQGENEGEQFDDQFLHRMSATYRSEIVHVDRLVDETCIVNEFRAYVEQYNPELITVLDTISVYSYLESQTRLGMTEQLFMRSRNRLKVLHRCYVSGEQPPRQRKIYRARAPKASAPVSIYKQQSAIA